MDDLMGDIGLDGDLKRFKNVQEMSDAINSKQYEIGDVVINLREYLTNTDQEKRAHGVKILSSILSLLDKTILTEKEVECLTDFFNDRLKDKAYVIDKAISGISSLISFVNYNSKMANSLFFTIQNELAIQMFKPDQKLEFYKIVHSIFQRFKQDFINVGSNFVYGILRIVDAETSPICLMEIFDLLYHISVIESFNLYSEDIFESMACYFPIIYSKSKNDKHYESKVKLSLLLNKAMASTTAFAEYVIQLALEKLESQSIESKISCYNLLLEALPIYKPDHVKKFTKELWTVIRIDTLKPEDDELNKKALETLAKISDVLGSDSAQTSVLLEKIWADLEISLKSPEIGLIEPAVKILTAFTSKNCDNFRFFFERAHPILLQSFIFKIGNENNKDSLKSFHQLIEYGHQIGFVFNNEDVGRFAEMLVKNSVRNDVEIQKTVILVLNQLFAKMKPSQSQFLVLIDFATSCVESSHYDKSIEKNVFTLIKTLSSHSSELMFEFYIKGILDQIESSYKLPVDQLQHNSIFCDRLLFQLNVLHNSTSNQETAVKILEFLIAKLSYFLELSELDIYQKLSQLVLDIFRASFDHHCSQDEFFVRFYDRFLLQILQIFANVYFVRNQHVPSVLVQSVADFNSNFISKLPRCGIEANVTALMNQILFEMNLSSLLSPTSKISFSSLNSFQQELILYLIYSYFYKSNHCIQSSELSSAFSKIKSYAFEMHLEQKNRDLFCMILSQIALRFESQENSFFDNELQDLKLKIAQNEPNVKTIALNLLLWLVKILFIRSDTRCVQFIEYFLQLEECDIVNKCTVQLIDIIYSNEDFEQKRPSDEELCSSHKFCDRLQELLISKYDQCPKNVYLYLLLSHLRFIPREVFIPKITQYIRVIVAGLQVNEFQQINVFSLLFLQNILDTSPGAVNDHLISLLRLTIGLANKSPSLRVRRMALGCIVKIADTCDESEIIKLKEQFVFSLRSTLADRKRLVRAAAAKAFCKLVMLGQPGNRKRV